MKKLISPGLSPNLEFQDVMNALRMLLSPFSLRSGESIIKVESWFKYNYLSKFAFTFSSARESLFALFISLNIKPLDEIIIQAFTCSAVVDPILWAQGKPIYVDIDKKKLSMDPQDLKKKITKKTRAIIIQHTFGIPGNIEEVKKIARDKKIFLIEDCAHIIGGNYKEKKLGMFADAAVFSFGRDKAISSVWGGIVITNKAKIAEKIKQIENLSPYPSHLWIYQQLLHPVLTFVILRAFTLHRKLGEILLFSIKKLHLISRPIASINKDKFLERKRTKRFPNALSFLAMSQLTRSMKFNRRRREITEIYLKRLAPRLKELTYDKNIPYLRFPLLANNKDGLMQHCQDVVIYLGDWYSNVIDPKGTDYKNVGYIVGSCKNAEKIASKIVNLPTYPTMTNEDAKRVIDVIISFYARK